jgi:hypothetical protein
MSRRRCSQCVSPVRALKDNAQVAVSTDTTLARLPRERSTKGLDPLVLVRGALQTVKPRAVAGCARHTAMAARQSGSSVRSATRELIGSFGVSAGHVS